MQHLALAKTQLAIEGDPLSYWWTVCKGDVVMRAFHAAPESDAWSVVYEHPVLLLPELVAAAERELGVTRETAGLRQMHASLRASPHYAAFHRMLAMVLANEQTGSPRVNLERALAIMEEVRQAQAHGPIDEEVEAAIRAQLERLPAPACGWAEGTQNVTPDPTWSRLFLELSSFKLTDDRRKSAPSPKDRPFATNGGLQMGACEWVGDEAAAVFRIVDTRWLFPSTKSAKTYLDSLKVTGFESDGLPALPPLPIGDGAYAWGGVLPGRTPPTRRQIVVFRVGRVVAKLSVTEGPKAAAVFQVLAPSMLQPYAEMIVRRVKWALAQYWLGVMHGIDAADSFVAAPPRTLERESVRLFLEYPILALPEFPTAMAALGEQYRAGADKLAALQRRLESTDWPNYRDVMRALVRALLDETEGEPLINADTALELVVDHRRVDADYSWAALEEEARMRTAPHEV